MTRMIALLRGINVGRAKRIAMADLRKVVEDLDYREVSTLLNSGNVVFTANHDTPSLAATQIEAAIHAQLGVFTRTLVLSAHELAEIIAQNPLVDIATDHSHLLISIPYQPDGIALLQPLLVQDWAPEVFALGTRAAYGWFPTGVLESKVAEAIGRILRDGVTSRNWATLLKLQALVTSAR